MVNKPKTERIDWEQIETRYVTGDETLRELCAALKASLSTLRYQSKRRDWVRKRKKFRHGIATKEAQKKKDAKVFDKERFDELAQMSCDAVVAALARKSIELFTGEKLSPDLGKKISEAVAKAVEVKYRILNIPPPKETRIIEGMNPFEAYQNRVAEARINIENAVILTQTTGKGKKKKGKKVDPHAFVAIEIEPPEGASN